MRRSDDKAEDVRIADNLRRTIELTELGLALRQSVVQQGSLVGDAMAQVMAQDSARERADMAAESSLVQTLSTLITEFNRRGLHYALAGGWA